MAIHEACQVWIEQRIQEELADKPESGKSLRQIGRELAEEIKKVFETTVHPNTLRQKATRAMAGTNVPPPATPQPATEKSGTAGDKLTPEQVVEHINAMLSKGESLRGAAKELAKETGQEPDALRQAYLREKERQEIALVPLETVAKAYALRALNYLNMIPVAAPERPEALGMVLNWINNELKGN